MVEGFHNTTVYLTLVEDSLKKEIASLKNTVEETAFKEKALLAFHNLRLETFNTEKRELNDYRNHNGKEDLKAYGPVRQF